MADKHKQAEDMRDDVPSTVARSDDKAVRTYKKTLESAEESYGDGERAHRTAFAALKHTHEKVGDHWEPKDHKGPSDPQAAKGGDDARKGRDETAGGVDANATKGHLEEVAKKVGIDHPEKLKKADLVEEIQKANDRATAKARQKDKT
jgi:ChaB protein